MIKHLRTIRVKSALLCFVMMMQAVLMCVSIQTVTVMADEKRSGCVMEGTTDVRIRTAPDTSDSSNIIAKFNGGKSLDILGEEFTSNSYSWYKVGFYLDGSYREGYIASQYVTVYKNVDYSQYASFKEYLTEQGFPESYHEGLIALHAQYPSWIFVADNTGLDWNYVVEKENYPGRSLVPNSYDSSKKSTAEGCYNWNTGEYTIWDSGSWVQASSAMVEYYLDPRNFLDSKHIFMFENLAYNGQIQTESGLNTLVSGTFLDSSRNDLSYGGVTYSTYVSALIAAGSMSGVSPYHLASRIIQEMGASGNSDSISGTFSNYENYYNYYNIGAYKTSSAGAIENGLKYAMKNDSSTLRPWSTRMLAIVGGAKIIGKNYINAGQNTLYYEKFDLKNFSHQYMTNIEAASSESVRAANGYSDKVKSETAMTFNIPVYRNMPGSASEYPSGKGSPNNKLDSLSVDGYSLTPTFSSDITDYSLIVPNATSSVNISASAKVSSATVSGTGSCQLKVGNNDITVSVKAQNGEIRKYNIRIVRENLNNDGAKGDFKSEYNVDNTNGFISGIGVGSNLSGFLSGITFNGGATGVVVGSDGKEKTENIATGDRFVVYDSKGNVSSEYKIILYGDVNGDGEINILDIVTLKRYMLDMTTLDGAYYKAADANRDGSVGILDIVALKKNILGIGYITQ